MSRAYKNRRKGSKPKYREQLMTPRSKRMKALRRLWRERREAKEAGMEWRANGSRTRT